MPPLFAPSPQPFQRVRTANADENFQPSAATTAPNTSSVGSKPPRSPRLARLPRSPYPLQRKIDSSNASDATNPAMASTVTEIAPGPSHDLSKRRSLSVRLSNLNFRTSPVSRAGDSSNHHATHNVGLAQLVSSISRRSPSEKRSSRAGETGDGKGNGKECVVESTNENPAKAQSLSTVERELLVLIHGLQGHPDDYTYLVDTLRSTTAHRTGRLMVHVPAVNAENTHDGIANGGERLVDDVRKVIRQEEDKGCKFHKLSILGFSLGGIYARYLAGALYQSDGTLAGLRAGALILVASPHLGVRKFGVYRFVPDAVCSAPVFSETVRELMLSDDRQILVRMTEDGTDEKENIKFLSSLKAFEERILYANLRNDFMVNFGTAALDTSIRGLSSGEVDAIMQARDVHVIDEEHDDKSCKVCFRYWLDGSKSQEKDESSPRDDASRSHENGDSGKHGHHHGDGHHVENLIKHLVPSSISKRNSLPDEEELMARRLRELGWWIIGVEFPSSLPIAHNRIVAMSRNAIHSWMNAPGKRVVHHMVDVIGRRFDEPAYIFRTSLGRPNPFGTNPTSVIPGSPDINTVTDAIVKQ